MSGTAKLTINLTDIQLSGRVIPVMTQPYSAQGRSEGKDAARKVTGGTGLGAVTGAIADGGEGAAKGAAVGAGVGTAASAATQGQQVVIDEIDGDPIQTPGSRDRHDGGRRSAPATGA